MLKHPYDRFAKHFSDQLVVCKKYTYLEVIVKRLIDIIGSLVGCLLLLIALIGSVVLAKKRKSKLNNKGEQL